MSVTVPQTYVYQFKDNVILLSQQMGSKLRPYVREETMTGVKHAFDRIGPTEVQEKTTRHSDTPQIDTQHDRRWVNMRDFGWADLIDREDKIRQLIEPTSPMTRNAVIAMGRKVDDLIIDAFDGDAESGQFGGTAVSFPTSTQQIVHGSAGLTFEKLSQAYRIFEDADVDMDRLYFVISPQGHEDLRAESEVQSADFNSMRPLVSGQVGYFMGFNFIVSTRLPKVSTTRSCFAWSPDGMGLAVGADLYVRSATRNDKWDSQEIFIQMSFAATRIEDVKVIEVQITES